VNVRSLFLTAVATGCGMTAVRAQEPAKLPTPISQSVPSANQTLADAVATRLASSGAAKDADVSISVTDGVVTITGTAKDQTIHSKVIQEVRTVAGVKKVRDGLNTKATSLLTRVQATDLPQSLPGSVGPIAAPSYSSAMPSMGGGIPAVEPTPLGAGMAGMPGADLQAPPLPPYAWPTYAPHNNLSRVAYPQAYPYNAYPFIGPFYPFPKVPPGWRKVTLEWDDGHWWIGKTQAPQDYWRVRFW
jgi:BON domain